MESGTTTVAATPSSIFLTALLFTSHPRSFVLSRCPPSPLPLVAAARMTDCCPCPDDRVFYCASSVDAASSSTAPSSPPGHSRDMASCASSSRPSSPLSGTSASSPSSFSPPPSSFSPRYALARRRRECLGLLESLRLSMNLSLKAITLLFCCVIMTVQYRAQQRRRAAAAASSSDESQPSSSASSAFASLFSSASKSQCPTLYQRLCVSKDATAEQIRTAHRRMAMRYHPDKVLAAHCASGSSPSVQEQLGGTDSPSHDMFIAIQEAYEVLSDPFERKRYDYALITGMTYTRLSSALRNVHGRADSDTGQEMSPFPAYIRRRPAAFTPTSHSADLHDNGRSSTHSSSRSSTSSTPQPVRASRSFSSIFSSPFVHVSPAPSTASASGTGSPPYHSPASTPSTPPTSPHSFSFLSSPSVTPPATAHATTSRSPASAAEAVVSLSSLLAVLFADAQSGAASFLRWLTGRLCSLALLPLRVALLLLAVIAERKKRMDEERRRMGEDEEAHRRRVSDEVSVSMYGWRNAAVQAY